MSQIPGIPPTRPIPLNREIKVSLPAYVWVSFCAAYAGADWEDPFASMIAFEAQHMIHTPAYMKEREAEHQNHRDEQERLARGFLGQIGIVPGGPDPDDPRAMP